MPVPEARVFDAVDALAGQAGGCSASSSSISASAGRLKMALKSWVRTPAVYVAFSVCFTRNSPSVNCRSRLCSFETIRQPEGIGGNSL